MEKGLKSRIGKVTRGYDPSQDIVWLKSEIVRWIEGNLMDKWYFLVLVDPYTGGMLTLFIGVPSRENILQRVRVGIIDTTPTWHLIS